MRQQQSPLPPPLRAYAFGMLRKATHVCVCVRAGARVCVGVRARADLSRARANRERAVAIREAARQSVQEMLQAKQRHATKERANDLLVTKAKVRVLESNRREVADRYRQRFVGHEEEQEWQSSPLRKLQQRFRGGFSSMSWVTDRSARDVEVAL